MKFKLLLLLSLLFIYGCAIRNPPCCLPCTDPSPNPNPTPTPRPPITLPTPNPTPTPSPIPTPMPTPQPTPQPTPNPCVMRHDPTSTCPEGISRYHNYVNQGLSHVTGCSVNSDCPLANWQKTLVDWMEYMNSKGFCTSYDLSGANPGSEAGVRLVPDNFTEYYQPITTAPKIRWADALSICVPVWDSNSVEDVKSAFARSRYRKTPK